MTNMFAVASTCVKCLGTELMLQQAEKGAAFCGGLPFYRAAYPGRWQHSGLPCTPVVNRNIITAHTQAEHPCAISVQMLKRKSQHLWLLQSGVTERPLQLAKQSAATAAN